MASVKTVVLPLAASTIAATAMIFVLGGTIDPGSLSIGTLFLVLVRILFIATAGSLLLVLPLLILFPRLRRPPLWLATVWGASVALVFAGLILGSRLMAIWSPSALARLCLAGAVSGLTYGLLARR